MADRSLAPDSTTFAFLLIPRFNLHALTATLEPLRVANYLTGSPLYSWSFHAAGGGSIVASNGLPIETAPLPEKARHFETVFVCGSWDCEHFEDAQLFAWLRRQDRFGVHLGAMDIGSYILARAGLLGGRRVAMLWYCAAAFAERFPEIEVEERLFVTDGKRTTIAGGAAGLDLMLEVIKRRQGPQLAGEVADHILHHPIRSGESAQRLAPGGQEDAPPPLLQKAIALMERHVEEPLSIPQVAKAVGLSQRKLERLFQRHMQRSAISYYRLLRLQNARVLLTNTELSIREISVACGYRSLSHFAKSFAEQFGKRPRDCRDAWPLSDPAPVWPGLSASLSNLSASRRARDA